MRLPLEQFVKQLEDSGVLAADTLKEFLPPKNAPKDSEELARELVRKKKLTKFQAEEVYRGKGKALVLGNYTLLDKLGAGGMGEVFRAEHRRMQRIVAVKVLPADVMRKPTVVARFEQEVRAAARLIHPNIVTAFDADKVNGVHLLVMEYVEGSDLAALVKKNGPLSVDKALNYLRQAALGLEAAHVAGIVHRDIKPANLLLDKKGVVKILDMGVARIGDTAGQAALTNTGAIMGTVDFMAPEQALNTKTADARADVYSLGCSLFYLLTGQASYDGDTIMAKLLAHRDQPIPSIRALRPEVSDEVEAVLKKMMAKRVEDRYQTMTEVIAALEKLGTGQQPKAAILPAVTTRRPADPTPDTNVQPSSVNLQVAPTSQVTTNSVGPTERTERRSLWKNTKVLTGVAFVGAAVLALMLVWLFGKGKPVPPVEPIVGVRQDDSQIRPALVPQPAVTPCDAAQAKKCQQDWADYLKLPVEYTNSLGMKFVLVPPGEFLMGSDDPQAQEREKPVHKVRITKPFYIGKYPVTVADFTRFVEATNLVTDGEKMKNGYAGWALKDGTLMKVNDIHWKKPGFEQTPQHPVVMVSSLEALEFCKWAASETGRKVRLPTEAEWEYAARGPENLKYPWGNTWNGSLANHADQSLRDAGITFRHTDLDQSLRYPGYEDNDSWKQKDGYAYTSPVGVFKNASWCGAFDMAGNVWQWSSGYLAYENDKYYASSPLSDPPGAASGGTARRGGSWLTDSVNCRASQRFCRRCG